MTMTNTEAVMLCRYTKACCPQQQIDEFTPDAWWDLLNDLEFSSCKQAIAEVAKRQPFVSPSEIRDQIGRVRTERSRAHGHLIGDNWPRFDNDLAEHVWNREVRRRIADGEITCAEDIPAWTEAELLAMAEPLVIKQRPEPPGPQSLAANAAAARAALAANRTTHTQAEADRHAAVNEEERADGE